MKYDMTFCINEGCPYTDCHRHRNRIKGETGIFSFANFDATCKRYIKWLAYSNYEKYIKLKGGKK